MGRKNWKLPAISLLYDHNASRALDPQIHTHCVVANVTWCESEQRYKALSECEILKAIRYCGKFYKNASFIAIKTIKCKFDRNTTTEEIQERAESIKSVGLIHSVKIQPIDDKTFQYKVVAGRKSFFALTTVLDKTKLVIGGESLEVTIINGDADLIAFAENHERVNLTLWEEVEKFGQSKPLVI